MTTVESRVEDLGRREVFIMGYYPDEPGVLQAWDTESESECSKTQCEFCMADHAAGSSGSPRALGTVNESHTLRPEENWLGIE